MNEYTKCYIQYIEMLDFELAEGRTLNEVKDCLFYSGLSELMGCWYQTRTYFKRIRFYYNDDEFHDVDNFAQRLESFLEIVSPLSTEPLKGAIHLVTSNGDEYGEIVFAIKDSKISETLPRNGV